MTEYTFAVIIAFFALLWLDKRFKTKILLPTKKIFMVTTIFLFFQLVFDNIFTAIGLWKFNSQHILGIYIPFIPIENLFFGAELLWLTLILYTHFSAH